jgi:hypothetical protein
MRSWTDRLAAAALAASLAAGAGAAPPPRGPADPLPSAGVPVEVHKVRFPDYNKDGTLKSEMFGDKALVEGNIVTITNLRMEMYEQGKLVTSFWAESCRYNRDAGTLESDSAVRVVRSGMMMTGDGMDWKKGSSVVVIRRNVRMLTIGGSEWFKVEKRK